MADIGSHMPVLLDTLEETADMKTLWIESKVKEVEGRIAALKRELLGCEQTLGMLNRKYSECKNSIDV